MDTTFKFLDKWLYVNELNIVDVKLKKDVLVHKLKKGNWFVLLQTDEGVKKLNYGLLLLYAGNRFHLPIKHWGKVTVGFLNDDDEDYSIDNLYVRFPELGIEHETIKGFFYIPGYELNLINKKGVIYRLTKDAYFEPIVAVGVDQYTRSTVCLNKSKIVNRSLHRLLAVTFKNPPENYPKLVVDHLNGKKWDFDLDNLEWVTYQVNNTRAVATGLRGDGKRVLVKDKENGQVKEYFSLTELARALDAHPQYIVDALTNPNQTYKKRWVIKDLEDERDWSDFEDKGTYSDSFSVKSRCVETGKVTIYKNQSEATRLTGAHNNTLRQFFRNNSEPCIINGYEFKREDDTTPWTEFNEYQIEIYKRNLHRKTRVYELTDLQTNEVTIHYGWKGVSKITRIGKRNIIRAASLKVPLNTRFVIKTLH